MNSFDINYILNNFKDLDRYDLYVIPSQKMPCYSYPASLINQNEIPIEYKMLTSSSATKRVLNKHERVGQYDTYAIQFELMPCHSYPANLVNQFEISINSSC